VQRESLGDPLLPRKEVYFSVRKPVLGGMVFLLAACNTWAARNNLAPGNFAVLEARTSSAQAFHTSTDRTLTRSFQCFDFPHIDFGLVFAGSIDMQKQEPRRSQPRATLKHFS